LSLNNQPIKIWNMEKNVKKFQFALSVMIIMSFLLMPLTVNGQTGKANFSGTWALNAEKSDFGQAPAGGQGGGGQRGGQGGRGGFGGGNFVATQGANLLTVERSRQNQNGETVKTETKYTLDGKESVNTTGRGDSKSVASWSADGKSLTIKTTSTFDMNGTSRTSTSTEVWSLTSPTTLSVKTTRSSQNGDRVTTMVYDKK
jgi:hypothetical protein